MECPMDQSVYDEQEEYRANPQKKIEQCYYEVKNISPIAEVGPQKMNFEDMSEPHDRLETMSTYSK